MGEKCKNLTNKVRKHSAHEINQARRRKKTPYPERLLCALNKAFNICDITPLALHGLLKRTKCGTCWRKRCEDTCK